MDGLSLHFYCGTAGTATEFTEEEYYRQIRQALDIEGTINRNWGFVVGYGYERKLRLVIDEWGCWHRGGSGPSSKMAEYGITPAPNNPDMVQITGGATSYAIPAQFDVNNTKRTCA